jgi:hypothetical protein
VIVVVAAAGSAFFVVEFRNGLQGPASTWTETMCRVQGYVVPDGDPWWYRLASAPWNGNYYATSDAFYNNGATSGSDINGVVVDQQVPVCSGS